MEIFSRESAKLQTLSSSELDYNIKSLTVPSIIVDNIGKIVSFNDSASIFFSNNISHRDNIKRIISDDIWDQIINNPEKKGSVEDLSKNILYFFKNYGNFSIIIAENISEKPEIKNKFFSEARYIAYLSHHINNPLTVVKNTHELVKYGLNLLKPHLENLLSASNKKDPTINLAELISLLYENIHDQGESLKQLEQNMRYLRNIGSIPFGGKIKSYKTASITQLSENIKDSMAFMLNKIEVSFNIEDHLKETLLSIDVDDFITLFYIIFENSVYAIRRTHDLSVGKISVTIAEESDSLIFLIENNGRKMSDFELSHCFEPFFSTKDNAEGLGLGLTNAAVIVKSYVGTITISNNNNSSGVIYKLTFPKYRVLK